MSEYVSMLQSGYPFCLELLLASLLFELSLNKRDRFPLRFLLSAVLMAGELLAYCALVRDMDWTWFLLVFLTTAAAVRFCCDVSWVDALYCAALAYATQHFSSSLYILLVYRGSQPQWNTALFIAVDAVVYVSFFLLFSRRLSEDGEYRVTPVTAVSVAVAVLFVSLFLSIYSKKAADAAAAAGIGAGYAELFRSCQLFDMVACFFLLWSQRMQRTEVKTSRALEKSRILWQQSQRQYALSRENVELINQKCHDLRHQIAALSYADSASERRRAFVRDVQNMLDVYDSKTDTGNEALNTILMEKGLYCKLHGIQWTCVADGGILNFMDVVDLYTLFGNAIDNAIESVEKINDQEKRIISASVWKKDNFAIIQIQNRYEGTLTLKNGLPLTSKGDTDNHGFGLRSMRKIAEKYQGTLSVKLEDKAFLLYVMLPLPEAAA